MPNIYTKNIIKYSQKLSEQTFKSKIVAYARGFAFIVAIISAYFLQFEYPTPVAIIISSLIIFLFLVKKSFQIKKQINILKAYIEINENEKKANKGDFSIFHSGKEFIDFDHSFSYDLDIFGEGSIFQYLNRTTTISGKLKLAEYLKNVETNKNIILKRQEANKELSEQIGWRQCFSATSIANDSKFHEKINSKQDDTLNELIKWTNTNVSFITKPIWKYILYIFPSLFLIMSILSSFGFVSNYFVAFWGLVNLSIVGFNLKTINKEHSILENKRRSLSKLQNLLLLIENKDFNSKYLRAQKQKLMYKNNISSLIINKLNRRLQSFDARLNIIVGVILNFTLLWDLQVLHKLEKQKKELQNLIPIWFDVIAEFDALVSFANQSFNNKGFIYPKVSKKNFYFKIKNGGHPLILNKDRITNDFEINGLHKIIIITGANMAGKSTFLRTVGINMILGACGTTVCAENFSFSPIQIYTSVRTNDSLHKNESYFYAELMRLKKITDFLKTGKKLFIILDEILKGTNSNDKHTGSKGLIKQLIKLNASGLVATHDVQLGNLSKQHPQNIYNKHFEVNNINNELVFDYKLKEGISQNLNASYLMKKYGIIE